MAKPKPPPVPSRRDHSRASEGAAPRRWTRATGSGVGDTISDARYKSGMKSFLLAAALMLGALMPAHAEDNTEDNAALAAITAYLRSQGYNNMTWAAITTYLRQCYVNPNLAPFRIDQAKAGWATQSDEAKKKMQAFIDNEISKIGIPQFCMMVDRLIDEDGQGRDRSARGLPACADPKVKEALAGALRTYVNLIQRDPIDLHSSSPNTRWCLAPLLGLPYPGLGGSCVELVFTIEWINEPEDRFWVQSKSQQRRTCQCSPRFPCRER
jgi:hypothetical protein